MKALHAKFARTNPWYAKWHERPLHKTAHWLVFVFVSVFITLSILTVIERTSTEAAAPQPSTAQIKKTNIVALNQELLRLSDQYEKADTFAKPAILNSINDVIAAREGALADAMKNNPKDVLLGALPDAVQKHIPAEVAGSLEKKVKIQGKVRVVVTDYADQKHSLEQRFIKDQKTDTEYELFLPAGSQLLPSSSTTVTGVAVNNQIAVSDTTAVASSATLGMHSLAVVLVNFQDQTPAQSNAEMKARMFTNPDSLAAYYTEQSFGKESFTGDVFGWYTIPYTSTTANSCSYGDTYASSAASQAAAQGVDLSKYEVVAYLIPNYDHGCSISGVAYGNVNVDKTARGYAYIYGASYDRSPDPATIAHEIGHVINLGHSSTVSCSPLQIVAYGSCETWEYGDFFSVMGGHNLLQNMLPPRFHMAAPQKVNKGWISGSNLQTITASGTYTITPIETQGSGTQVLKIDRPTTDDALYISYRQPLGFDRTLPSGLANVTVYSGFNGGMFGSILYNTGPWSSNGNTALGDGVSITDAATGVTITQLNHTATSASVSVTMPTTVCTKNTPTVSVTPSSGSGTSAQTELYTLTVTNNDSASCATTTFIPTSKIPTGWTASFSITSLPLSPGATNTTVGYITPASTTTNGTYTLTLGAADGADTTHIGSAAPIPVTITNIVNTDAVAPVANISSPANGTKIKGKKTTIKATASDNVKVARMELYIDNVLKTQSAPNTASATLSYNWSAITPGSHTITVKAYDPSNNIGTKTVTVTN